MQTEHPMTGPLSGRRVLVTRPSHQAEGQASLLRAQGAEPVMLPLLSIEPITASDPEFTGAKQCILDLDLYRAVIVVSANAARLGISLIDSYWPQLPVGIHWLAIGSSTATRLLEYGIEAVHSQVGYDSEALLDTAALQHVSGERILLLRGDGGRDTLATELCARGARVDHAILYRRALPALDQETVESAVSATPLSAILITSGESLNNLIQLAHRADSNRRLADLQHCQLVVPSQRIATQATEVGFKHIILASGPDDQSMVGALLTQIDSEQD